VKESPRVLKILVIFSFLFLFCVIFVFYVFYLNVAHNPNTNTMISRYDKPLRGDILSKEKLALSTSTSIYVISYNPKNINPNKKYLFAKLLATYSGNKITNVLKKINNVKNTNIIEIPSDKYIDFVLLKAKMDKMRVYKTQKNNTRIGISLLEKEKRVFVYDDVLSPVLGYMKKDTFTAIKGIEYFYDKELKSGTPYKAKGQRDIFSNIIFNGKFKKAQKQNEYNIHLNIDLRIQAKIEYLLTKYQKKLQSDEIIIGIMNSKNGKMLVLATSNRFNPNNIKTKDIPNLNVKAIEYAFEPGSVMKPIVLSFLLEKNKVKISDMVNGHNGKYKIGRRTIRDDHPIKKGTIEDAIIHSSNIILAKLGMSISPKLFFYGLGIYGFGNKSGIDLHHESKGVVPSILGLKQDIKRATVSYGYGIQATFIQLLKAYNVFNNGGKLISPKIAEYIHQGRKTFQIDNSLVKQAISSKTANIIKQILIKTVQEGTGQKAIIKGLEIGGKTGTARVVKDGRYVREYISSFFGFVNDRNNSYTIGVSVFNPKTTFYASSSAVPVFKKSIEILLEGRFLKISPKPTL